MSGFHIKLYNLGSQEIRATPLLIHTRKAPTLNVTKGFAHIPGTSITTQQAQAFLSTGGQLHFSTLTKSRAKDVQYNIWFWDIGFSCAGHRI